MSGVAVCKRKAKPRKPSKTEVDGLNMNGIQGTIRWTGLVHLDQTNEDLECLLSETVWPRKTGASYFACASTGLLFDKQTGECRQSRKMRLRLDTVAESKKSSTKYRNKKTRVGALVFDSKLEAARYVDLKKLEEGGVISGLQCQVPFKIEVNDQLICKYIADFVYLDCDRKRVVEDAKGKRTDVYALKKKMMRAILGIEIQEFRKEDRHARKS